MSYLKLILWCSLIITLYGLSNGLEELQDSKKNEEISLTINNKTAEVEQDTLSANTNTRTGRVLVHPPPRAPAFTLRRRQPIQIRSRADHFPIRQQIRRVYNGVGNGQQPPNLRYGYESLKSSKYMPSSKGGQFLNNGKGSGGSYRQQLLGGHPNSVHVPALSQQYIHNFKASPTFNGNVVVHPAGQPQQQQQQQQQSQQPPQDNSYPKYVKPPQQQQQQVALKPQAQPQPQQPLIQYPDFKQFPIPDQDQMQKYNEQHEKYLQQQKYLTPRDTLAYYQQQQQQQQQNFEVQQSQYIPQKPTQLQQQLQQPSIPIHAVSAEATADANNIGFPSTGRPQKMYSVYEENDMTELQNNNYQTASYQGLDKEAQEYLRFMNTNEYFLPKKDPNYKLIDEENDRKQFNNLKNQQQQTQQLQQQNPLKPYAQSLYQQQEVQQPETPYQQPQPQPQHHALAYQQSETQTQQLQQQQQQKLYQQSQQQSQLYSNNRYSDTSGASSYNQPIKVSKLFYDYNQDENKASSPASSTVVKTSYQAGYNHNQFLVNPQDNNVNKFKKASSQSTTTTVATQSPLQLNNVYAQVRQNGQSSRTPEPLRFEFTERDAMIGGVSYTHAPLGQLRYKTSDDSNVTPKLPAVESSTTSSTSATAAHTYHQHHNHVVKPVVELDDDPEDGDDIQEAGTNVYGRQPVVNRNSNNNQEQTSTTETIPSEQKDTEEYCERICAIVEDEHEEIICGSDGYMYTSEAQMECYASCLHIDVTIQGKGSCSSR